MAGRGGYRRPGSPAAVSGPGALSKRTDGKANMMDLPDAGYGENADFKGIEAGATLGAGNPPAGPPVDMASAAPSRPVVPLSEGTQMPDTPVTAGADYGPGVGSGALGLGPTEQDVAEYGKYLPFLLKLANDPNTSKSTRTAIRQLFSKS